MSDQPDAACDVKGPLVFSCIKCKTIVGDSFSLFYTNEEFKTITLSASSNIQRTNELYTSNQEHDNGSSYFCFICLTCHQPLGRYYVTTNTNLDNVREKFTFDIDSISSYEVGKAQHGKSVEPEELKEANGVIATETAAISEEVLKIQHVVVDLAQRLLALENLMAASMQRPQSMHPPIYHPSSSAPPHHNAVTSSQQHNGSMQHGNNSNSQHSQHFNGNNNSNSSSSSSNNNSNGNNGNSSHGLVRDPHQHIQNGDAKRSRL